jgi:MFS family permease
VSASHNSAIAVARLPSWLTPARLTMALFALQAATSLNWFPRIPDIQHALGLGPAELSIAMLGMPIGGFISMSFAARFVERFSARGVLMAAWPVYCLTFALPGWAWNTASLGAALFLMGATYVVNDLAVNVEATRIQAQIGRRIISRCHGLWSVGSIVGSVSGGAFAQFGVDTRWHLLIVALVMAPAGVALARLLPALPPEKDDGVRKPIVALPSVAMIGLCIFAFGVILAELTTRNWGAVYLRETIGASAAWTGIGYGLFSAFMAGGRLFGDTLTVRYGPVAIGRICGVVSIVGILALVVATGLPLAIFGFAAIGLGISVGFPLAIAAAAGQGDRSPAVNVAALSLVAYSGSLLGPPLVGFIAEGWGLRAGLAAALPVMVVSVLYAGSLGRTAKKQG